MKLLTIVGIILVIYLRDSKHFSPPGQKKYQNSVFSRVNQICITNAIVFFFGRSFATYFLGFGWQSQVLDSVSSELPYIIKLNFKL